MQHEIPRNDGPLRGTKKAKAILPGLPAGPWISCAQGGLRTSNGRGGACGRGSSSPEGAAAAERFAPAPPLAAFARRTQMAHPVARFGDLFRGIPPGALDPVRRRVVGGVGGRNGWTEYPRPPKGPFG